MPLIISQRTNVCHIKFEGDLTIFQMAEYHPQLLSLCQTCSKAEVDLGDVTELDAAGVQLLLSLEKKFNTKDSRQFSITKQSEPVTDTLSVLNLVDHFGSIGGK